MQRDSSVPRLARGGIDGSRARSRGISASSVTVAESGSTEGGSMASIRCSMAFVGPKVGKLDEVDVTVTRPGSPVVLGAEVMNERGVSSEHGGRQEREKDS